MDNVLTLRGIVGWSINDQVVSDFLKKMDGKGIEVGMHTYGGNVFEGNLIYNSFKKYAGKKTLIIEGVCASMGTIIMGAFDEVSIVKNGFIMIHAPSGYTEGNANAHESNAKVLRSMEKNFKEVYKQRTEYKLDSLMDGNDHWFDADEALANGFVDYIIEEEVVIDLEVESSHKGQFEKTINYLKSAYQGKLNPTLEVKPIKPIIQNQSTMKNLFAILITMGFALTVEATEAQAIDAIKAKFKEKDDEIKRLNELLAKQVEDGKKAILDNALASKRINAEQHKKLTATASKLATVEDVTELLEGVAGQSNITDLIKSTPQGGSTKKGRENWTWDDYQEKDPNALDKMRTEDEESYNALYNNRKFGA